VTLPGQPPQPSRRVVAEYVYIAIANGYTFGVVGPATAQIAGEFGVSLAMVGLLATALYLVHAATQLPSSGPIQRYGSMRVARVAFAVMGLANVVAVLAPSYAVLLLSRLVVGAGTAPSFVGSLNAARQAGGAALAGLFGGLTLLASGSAIVLGSQFADAGISWRWNFALAALLAFGAVAIGPRDAPGAAARSAAGSLEQVRAVIRVRALWRLVLLYAATFGSNFVLSVWVVEFVAPGRSAKELAGLVGFVILGASAGFRWWGGVLSDRGAPWNLIAPGATLVAAAAMAVFAVSQWLPLAFGLAALIGFGLALPFGAIFTASFRAEPAHPAAAIALVNMSAAVFAVVVAPLAGFAFDQGRPWLVPAGLAAFAAFAALVNLRRRPPGAPPAG